MKIWASAHPAAAALIRTDTPKKRVEMWTVKRLPYGRRDAFTEVRAYLAKELRGLAAEPGQQLLATYASAVHEFVDTENVLLYNVGMSAFANSSRFGLRFQREFTSPPAIPAEQLEWHHYHSYSLEDHGDHSIPSNQTVRLRFELPRISTSLKPHLYWWAAKQGTFHRIGNTNLFSLPFCMSITLVGPPIRCNLAEIVKPLFDGVISALHYYPGILSTDVVCNRIATELKISSVQVAEQLSDPTNAILGGRIIVRPTRTFVAWNPADEHCLIGELFVKNSSAACWSVEVALSSVEGAPGR
jgi:hypothetical protein